MQDPSKWHKTRPPTASTIITPQGVRVKRKIIADSCPRPKEGSSQSLKVGETSLSLEEDSPAPKKRKNLELEDPVHPFTELSWIEKANSFNSVVKLFVTKSNIKVYQDLNQEEEAEALHSTSIDVSASLSSLFKL